MEIKKKAFKKAAAENTKTATAGSKTIRKDKPKSTSFLLRNIDRKRLKNGVAKVSKISSRKISESLFFKALLLKSEQMTDAEILELVKDVIF